ncbi:hypothetical protein [Streptomyces sp. MNP-20]|uniref:hypothetical protein n=2 Tax=Streptomyces sp. MNP-20 TaxID=2721165 RepID=UPI00155262D5|nr:hypothetical protein [Streptomyces sp. MNP-20]
MAALVAAVLTGCSGDGADDGGPFDREEAGGEPFRPLTTLKVPAGYDPKQGWDQEINWVPESIRSIPVTVAEQADVVAYLLAASDGYTVQTRDVASGTVRWSSAPWNPPPAMEGAEGDPDTDEAAEIPDVTTVRQGGQEYIVAFARGMKGKDELHEGEEVVDLAVFPARVPRGSRSVEPLRRLSLPVDATADELRVRDGGSGLLVTWGGATGARIDVVSGKVTHYGDVDELMPKCEETLCSGSRVATVSSRGPVVAMDGGFGVPGGWLSKEVTPPGADTEEGLTGEWPGTLYAAGPRHVVAHWQPEKRAQDEEHEVIWTIHDAESGEIAARVACEAPEGSGGFGNEELARLVGSNNGRYAALGSVVFDLKTHNGRCLAGDGNRKKIAIAAVRDDGMAYGAVAEDSEDKTAVTVEVSLADGHAKPLATGTEFPLGTLKSSGLFLTRDDSDNVVVSIRAWKK